MRIEIEDYMEMVGRMTGDQLFEMQSACISKMSPAQHVALGQIHAEVNRFHEVIETNATRTYADGTVITNEQTTTSDPLPFGGVALRGTNDISSVKEN